jgi:Holliday junction resolvase-like predicted endonuclease
MPSVMHMTKKDIGNYGEKVTCAYLYKHGFDLIDRNVSRKTGEIDIIMRKGDTLHFIEVKTLVCMEFPKPNDQSERYDPSANLHPLKISKVQRTSEWYMADIGWEGESQIDGALILLRKRDCVARVRYVPQIL